MRLLELVVCLCVLASFSGVNSFTISTSTMPSLNYPLSSRPSSCLKSKRLPLASRSERQMHKATLSMGLFDDLMEKLEKEVSLETTSSFAQPGTPVMVLFEGKVTKRQGEADCGRWKQATLVSYDAATTIFTVKLQDGSTVQGLVPGIKGIGGDDGFIPEPSGERGVFIREKDPAKDRQFYLSVLPQFLFGVVPFLILLSPAITYPLKKLFNIE